MVYPKTISSVVVLLSAAPLLTANPYFDLNSNKTSCAGISLFSPTLK